jgi:UDP-glucose 4,6-dehydratase
MIVLIGHGYVGSHIAEELERQKLPFVWASHQERVPVCTNVIINAAGYTGVPNVDACETHKQDCIDGNVLWPIQLEQANPHTPIVHISSGCVYTGHKEGGFTELDPPNFDFDNGSFYSGSKALAQQLLMPYMHKSWLLRIRMPFGRRPHPKNFLTKLETYNKLVDFENSLSCVEDVARTAVRFALERPWFGIYNVVNPGSATTRQIADMMGLKKEWFTTEEFSSAVTAPRSNCVLNSHKLQRVAPISPLAYTLSSTIEAYRKASS